MWCITLFKLSLWPLAALRKIRALAHALLPLFSADLAVADSQHFAPAPPGRPP